MFVNLHQTLFHLSDFDGVEVILNDYKYELLIITNWDVYHAIRNSIVILYEICP